MCSTGGTGWFSAAVVMSSSAVADAWKSASWSTAAMLKCLSKVCLVKSGESGCEKLQKILGNESKRGMRLVDMRVSRKRGVVELNVRKSY
jgi:hypothetical protein